MNCSIRIQDLLREYLCVMEDKNMVTAQKKLFVV